MSNRRIERMRGRNDFIVNAIWRVGISMDAISTCGHWVIGTPEMFSLCILSHFFYRAKQPMTTEKKNAFASHIARPTAKLFYFHFCILFLTTHFGRCAHSFSDYWCARLRHEKKIDKGQAKSSKWQVNAMMYWWCFRLIKSILTYTVGRHDRHRPNRTKCECK